MDEQERLELRRRVMRTVYMVGESGVSVEQLMRAVEKYADVQDKERLARALAECLTQPMNMTENLMDEKKTVN